MLINNENLLQSFKRLRQYSESLHLKVQNDLPHIEKILAGTIKLPENCPSVESGAWLAFAGIRGYLQEVNAAAAEIEKAFRERPDQN